MSAIILRKNLVSYCRLSPLNLIGADALSLLNSSPVSKSDYVEF